MIRYLVLFFLLKSVLLGCSLCSVYSPRTHIKSDIVSDKNFIKSGKISWTFSKEFTNELIQIYDTDLDLTFNKDELSLIEDSLLGYIEPKNYLTFISYGKEIPEVSNKLNVTKKALVFRGNKLIFEYEFDLNYKIVDKNKLYLEVYDEAGYFIMIFQPKKQLLKIPYKIKKEQETNSVLYTISAPGLKEDVEQAKEKVVKNVKKEKSKQKIIIDESLKQEESEQEVKEVSILESFVSKVKKYLVLIEKGQDTFALFFLLFVSFVYGVIHALGPGHGKALAFSYFSSQKSSYFQAFIISLATGFVHIAGALILVVFSVFVLQSVFSSFLNDSIFYITALSAVLIMLLSIYILYRKLKKKSCACSACCSVNENKPMFTAQKQDVSFVKSSTNKIHMNVNRKKQDLIFVIFAGIVPCPGTVVLFVYAFVLKTYFSVILASIAISLGMGLVIFASSFLGVSLNKRASSSQKFIDIVEIIAPIIMFILGLLLFLNANNL